MPAETWGVELDDGSVREVVPRREAAGPHRPDPKWWASDDDGGNARDGESARVAVAAYASAKRWPVAAILAPGEVSAEDRIAAAVKAELEACKAAVRDAAAADDNGLPWCNCLDALNARGAR